MEVIKYTLIQTEKFVAGMDKHSLSGQKKLLIKIFSLLEEIQISPQKGTGKPEELKGYGERSVWSRRIDQKHRLTYEIFEDPKIVKILACYGHYDD